jgi:hypothetical protein
LQVVAEFDPPAALGKLHVGQGAAVRLQCAYCPTIPNSMLLNQSPTRFFPANVRFAPVTAASHGSVCLVVDVGSPNSIEKDVVSLEFFPLPGFVALPYLNLWRTSGRILSIFQESTEV